MGTDRIRSVLAVGLLVVGAPLFAGAGAGAGVANASSGRTTSFAEVVPAPVTARQSPHDSFTLGASTRITAAPGTQEVAGYLGRLLRPATGYMLPVTGSHGSADNTIALVLGPAEGPEGYRLDVTRHGITLRAERPAGLFAGVQTLRQLFPAQIEARHHQPGPWTVPGGHIADRPRYEHRGAMLDVARHFFSVEQVEKYIDQLSMYKINTLHLHLTDDQGWRIEIKSWPRLTSYGSTSAVDGDPGGFYTQADYKRIVRYASDRFITIVPEIDMPGHVNAALASYAELNCDGKAPPLYTGTEVGFSSFCVAKDITYRFIDDVIRELAAITPGAYIHVGGDEAHSTPEADYIAFMKKVEPIVAAHGKKVLAWHQLAAAAPLPNSTLLQYWDTVTDAPTAGAKLVLSPANKTYLDMKYDENTRLGQDWAGLIEVKTAYDWNPGTYLQGVRPEQVLGVEAPLWTETIRTQDDIEFMAFPRLPAIAELGWSPASTHDWSAFRVRLAAQAPRWRQLGIDFYPSAQVPWH
jgi:hexosaminidase